MFGKFNVERIMAEQPNEEPEKVSSLGRRLAYVGTVFFSLSLFCSVWMLIDGSQGVSLFQFLGGLCLGFALLYTFSLDPISLTHFARKRIELLSYIGVLRRGVLVAFLIWLEIVACAALPLPSFAMQITV